MHGSAFLNSCIDCMQDVNKNGVIMYTEFIAATLEAQGHIEEERVAEAFDRLDSDDSGFISRKNLSEFLGSHASSQEIQDLINEIDGDGDGQSKSVLRVDCLQVQSFV